MDNISGLPGPFFRNEKCALNSSSAALQPRVGFGLLYKVIPLLSISNQLLPVLHLEHLHIFEDYINPSILGSSCALNYIHHMVMTKSELAVSCNTKCVLQIDQQLMMRLTMQIYWELLNGTRHTERDRGKRKVCVTTPGNTCKLCCTLQ